MFVNEFQDYELALDDRLLRKIQARFRGAAVRNSMRKVLEDYAAVFDEIEEKPSCSIKWHLAKHAVVGKPQFIPLDRRNCVRLDATKSHEPVNSDMSLPLVQNFSDKELQPVHWETLDTTKMNLELLNNDAPAISVPQSDNNTSSVNLTDLTSALVMQQERELNACNVDDRQNEDTSVDHSGRDNCDSATVVSSVALQENFQTSSTGIPVSLVGSTLQEQRHNLALELLWVQQAIHSRKQYLRLKSQLAERSSS